MAEKEPENMLGQMQKNIEQDAERGWEWVMW